MLDQLRVGDSVIVETATTWYTYTVYEELIVAPTQVDVVYAVPGDANAQPEEALMTLTTCNPRWDSYERLIFHTRVVGRTTEVVGSPIELQGA